MTHQVIVDRDPGDETTHNLEGVADITFGGNDGLYFDTEGNERTADEVLS